MKEDVEDVAAANTALLCEQQAPADPGLQQIAVLREELVQAGKAKKKSKATTPTSGIIGFAYSGAVGHHQRRF